MGVKIIVDLPKSEYEYLAKLALKGDEPLGHYERTLIGGKPLPQGHWIEKMDACECPYCHKAWDYFDNDTEDFDYCPKCGAKLSEIPTGSESEEV